MLAETRDQIALLEWSKYVRVGAYWLNELLVHVPNGGARNPREGSLFKAMGVKSGWPDLQLMVPVKEFHGAFWELKSTDGRVRPNQIERHTMLRQFGYYVSVFNDWEQCSQDILRYLALPGAPAAVWRDRLPPPRRAINGWGR